MKKSFPGPNFGVTLLFTTVLGGFSRFVWRPQYTLRMNGAVSRPLLLHYIHLRAFDTRRTTDDASPGWSHRCRPTTSLASCTRSGSTETPSWRSRPSARVQLSRWRLSTCVTLTSLNPVTGTARRANATGIDRNAATGTSPEFLRNFRDSYIRTSDNCRLNSAKEVEIITFHRVRATRWYYVMICIFHRFFIYLCPVYAIVIM